jgi:nucleoside phosphorylase
MSQPIIDIGILTIREDEFRAVLNAFPDDHGIYKGRHREYTLRTADAGQGARYRLAILRQIEQGNGEAQEAARDLFDDLQPSLFLVVGVAGGLPSEDISLGDVVVSTRVLDFSIEARNAGSESAPTKGAGSAGSCGESGGSLPEMCADVHGTITNATACHIARVASGTPRNSPHSPQPHYFATIRATLGYHRRPSMGSSGLCGL